MATKDVKYLKVLFSVELGLTLMLRLLPIADTIPKNNSIYRVRKQMASQYQPISFRTIEKLKEKMTSAFQIYLANI